MAESTSCSVIIATLDRADSLRVVLRCLARQIRRPCEVLLAVAGDGNPLTAGDVSSCPFPVRIVSCPEKSSARQRNLAAAAGTGDVLAFLDDDIEFGDDLFARVLVHFDRRSGKALGALSPRIANTDRTAPGWLTRWYYTVQAGYAHADFGGRLFGPGINCFPIYPADGPQLVPVEWLPATCLFIRADLFHRHRFPQFTGYSFAEDVHLTARAAHEAPLFFLREPAVVHHSLPSEFKSERAALTAGKLHNMAVVARDAQGLHGWQLWWRWQLHRIFLSAVLLLRRPDRWTAEFQGVWLSRL